MEAGKAEGQYDSTDGESSVVQDGSIQGRRNQTERGTALEDVPETSPNITPFHRSMTLPPRPRHAADDTTNNDRPTRHRGRTISSRPRNFDSIPLSEEAPSSGPRRRASTRAISPTNISNVRARLSSNSGRPQRRNTLARAPSFGAATGRSGSVVGGFSLAGLQDPIASQHQPYVDPGYAELNPAYEQPGNVRPVWGLAKPLPRVLRPGMVPSPSELHMSVATDESEVKHENDQADVELGKGTVDPAIPLGRISSQLQTSRRTRGHPIFRSFSSRASSNLYGRDIANEPGLLTPHNETSELQEDQNDGQRIDAAAKNSDYFGSSFANDTSSEQFPFPDITESEATEVDEKAEKDWPDEDGYTTTYDYQEEVHNHHTQWSEIRLRFREPLAEFLAGTVQLTLGFCTSLSITTSRETDAVSGALGWGLASMVGIYVAGGISGAHLNPAISIMLWIYRGFPLRKVFLYVPAQLLAGFVAALISYGIHRQNILEYGGPVLGLGGTANSFVTSPRHDWIDASTAFFTEFTGTAILAISVLALGDDSNAPPGAGMNALVIGLIITSICMAFGNNTGIAMNPSRDFGPRLALLALGYGGDLFRNGWWVYGPWAGTITGAIFGAGLYDIAIFVGGESPINYPRRRMKRAGRKWRKKWAGRIWRAERKMKGGVNEEHSS